VFNLQGSEIIIILLLALVVLGPEKLPDAMRKAGKAYAELKKLSSGFQEEFKAAVDEPMREMRDTANLLRDSADFNKLKTGEREEKPKSAEMVAPADPDAVPTDDLPFSVETDDDVAPSDDSGHDGVAQHRAPDPTTEERRGDNGLRESDPVHTGAEVRVTPWADSPKPFSSMGLPESPDPIAPLVADSTDDVTGPDPSDEPSAEPGERLE
jgi:Tat protein translocase TatB subunit